MLIHRKRVGKQCAALPIARVDLIASLRTVVLVLQELTKDIHIFWMTKLMKYQMRAHGYCIGSQLCREYKGFALQF